ncbi:hypothetical protein BGY98DRAFT_930580 [Russula aff. rugulosa BPL654]|nr:hypothetical protein BGY98DRAFT_930580 [Russula aff. rugulosa BPL654]
MPFFGGNIFTGKGSPLTTRSYEIRNRVRNNLVKLSTEPTAQLTPIATSVGLSSQRYRTLSLSFTPTPTSDYYPRPADLKTVPCQSDRLSCSVVRGIFGEEGAASWKIPYIMDIASADEVLAVQLVIRSHELQLESIDIAIQDVFRQLQQLRAKRAYHMDTIAKCRGSISLARRAPDDVLALIFEHAAAGGLRKVASGQLCSPRVVLYPSLKRESVPVAKTRLWLSRALQSPLSVTIDVRVFDPHILDAFELILEHASQWRTLTLSTRFAQQANDILSQCRRPFPYLQTIDITSFSIGVATEQGMDELTGVAEAFADAPSLSYSRIVSNRFPVSVPQSVVNLSLQLGDIASSRPSLSAALEMLGTLPALRSLTLVIPRHFVQIINYGNPTSETCLHHLERLIIDAPPDFNAILQSIQAPTLQYLHLRSTEPPLNHPHEGTGEALLQFLKSSKPPMKLLELHDVDIRRDDFVQCFLTLPLLEELRLHETEISNDALLFLHGPTGACPRLKRLDLRWCEQLAGQALVDLVQSRVDSSGNRRGSFDPIEEITVINCALVDEASVLNLAHATVCSVVVRDLEDHCQAAASTSERPGITKVVECKARIRIAGALAPSSADLGNVTTGSSRLL